MTQTFGWLPDYPDFRDRTFAFSSANNRPSVSPDERVSISALRDKAGSKTRKTQMKKLPASVLGLEEYFLPADQQGKLNSCTAHAGCALVEYFENRTFGDCEKKSRLFLYKVTRNLLKMQGDSGAFIRSTMKSMVLFGIPPEKYYEYEIAKLDEEPSQFCYAFAQNYQAIQYYRLDPPSISTDNLLDEIKRNLVKGLPMMFGFTVYTNINRAKKGLIPFPASKSKSIGGHAVVAMGYDDKMEITNEDGRQSIGAFRIRNSWGEEWGEEGYGWLPYDYLKEGLARDWWSLIRNEWIDSRAFE